MRGAPNDLSSTTLRPLGPRVTRTASARMSIPCSILSRASRENFTSLAAIVLLLDYPLRSPGDNRFPPTICADVKEGASGSLLFSLRLDEHSHDIALFHD